MRLCSSQTLPRPLWPEPPPVGCCLASYAGEVRCLIEGMVGRAFRWVGRPAKPRSLEPCTIPLTQRESWLLRPLGPRAFRILGPLYPCGPWGSCTIRTFAPFRPLDSYTFRILGPLYPCGPLSYRSIRSFLDLCAMWTLVRFGPLCISDYWALRTIACPSDPWTFVSFGHWNPRTPADPCALGPLCLVDPGIFGPLGLLYPANP